MKKQLLCTSAIALGALAAAPASAAEWDVSWGGFINQHVVIADVDTDGDVAGDFDGVEQLTTGEIIFHPSITLDNGLTFGANVQFEAQNNGGGGDGIDESYVEISSETFGRLVIGNENSAGYLLTVAAPTVTSFYINSPSVSSFLPISSVVPYNFRQAGISLYTEVAGNNDVQRITYYTPSFNGLTIGASYARNNNGNADQGFFDDDGDGNAFELTNDNDLASLEDIWDVGINYNQTFGGVGVSFGARYGEGSGVDTSDDAYTFAVGSQISFANVTIGGGYAENDNDDGAFGADQSGWNVGITYDLAGPWAFGVETFQGTFDDSSAGGTDEHYRAYQVAASRDIGPGVDWDLHATFIEGTEEDSADDVSAFIVGTSLNLSF